MKILKLRVFYTTSHYTMIITYPVGTKLQLYTLQYNLQKPIQVKMIVTVTLKRN